MKVSAIEGSRINSIHRQKNTHKKDLTSFGVNQSREEIDAKKSDEAIKTTFLSNVSFKGHTVGVDVTTRVIGTAGHIFYNRQDGQRSIDSYYYGYYSYKTKDDLLKNLLINDKEFYPNSSIEEIRNLVLSQKNTPYTVNIYVADPQEGITKEIRAKNDYIVYDNEPKFPSLGELRCKYLSNEREDETNYHQFCETIFRYHERLKDVDIKTLVNLEEEKVSLEKEAAISSSYRQNYVDNYVQNPWDKGSEQKAKAEYFHDKNNEKLQKKTAEIDYYKARLGYSKEQQGLAVELYNILNESGELFIKRDELLKEKERLTWFFIPGGKYGHVQSKEDIYQLIDQQKNQLQDIEEKLKTTNSWYELREQEAKEINEYHYNEKEKAKQELEVIKQKIEKINKEIEEKKEVIAKLEAMPEKYDRLNNTLRLVLRKLQQNFTKVEKFYATNARRLRCC